MILAAILFVLELLAPGIFMMWFGMAAAVTGLIVSMALQIALIFGSVSAGSSVSVRPKRSRSCVTTMIVAMPAVKPTVTG